MPPVFRSPHIPQGISVEKGVLKIMSLDWRMGLIPALYFLVRLVFTDSHQVFSRLGLAVLGEVHRPYSQAWVFAVPLLVSEKLVSDLQPLALWLPGSCSFRIESLYQMSRPAKRVPESSHSQRHDWTSPFF